METYSLYGKTRGGAEAGEAKNAHFWGQTLATGARMGMLDGTPTGLVVWETAIGTINPAGHVTEIISAATVSRTVTIPDTTAPFAMGDGSGIADPRAFRAGFGQQTALFAVDQTVNGTAPKPIIDLSLPLAASQTYHLRMVLRVSAPNGGGSLRLQLNGPADSVTSVDLSARVHDGHYRASGLEDPLEFGGQNGDTDLYIIEGLIRTSAVAPTSFLEPEAYVAGNGQEIILMAGSHLTLTAL